MSRHFTISDTAGNVSHKKHKENDMHWGIWIRLIKFQKKFGTAGTGTVSRSSLDVWQILKTCSVLLAAFFPIHPSSWSVLEINYWVAVKKSYFSRSLAQRRKSLHLVRHTIFYSIIYFILICVCTYCTFCCW